MGRRRAARQRRPPSWRSSSTTAPPAGRRRTSPGRTAGEAPAVATELDEPRAPVVARNRRRQVKAERRVGAEDADRRRQGGGGVDDEQVTRVEQLRELGEAGVLDAAAAAVGDQQADVVATGPANLGGLAGLGQRGHLLSIESDAHACDGLSSRAA